MTYLEKLKQEHPTWALLVANGFEECPVDYGYPMPKTKMLCTYLDAKPNQHICRRCWEQEMEAST